MNSQAAIPSGRAAIAASSHPFPWAKFRSARQRIPRSNADSNRPSEQWSRQSNDFGLLNPSRHAKIEPCLAIHTVRKAKPLRQYTPKPVDTKTIKLDPTLLELVEYLARNTHEVWSAGRIREGWTWGPQRDDASRRHPGLIPYEQLTESEKRFDRDTAMETLKLIAACGYGIQPPASPFHPETTARDLPGNIVSFELAQLVDFWKGLAPAQCHGDPTVYLGLADRALALGEYLLAYDVLKEGLRFYPSDVALRQRQGLAMRRGGAVTDAAATLEELAAEGNRDVETLGLLAACYK